jgi:phage minor structural protein, N-terminal region
MYVLKTKDDLIYSATHDELAMLDIKVAIELNKTGTLEFRVPPTHQFYEAIKKVETDVYLYEDDVLLWKFRVLNDELDFANFKNVICEGQLSYLLDTIQRPYEFHGGISDLFAKFLAVHNSQVEERKRFKLGIVNVNDTAGVINRYSETTTKTLEDINEKLLKTHGGYLRVRYEDDGNYLDYLEDYNRISSQEICFGKNLLDITRFIKGENIRTAIIPLGAETDEEGINGVKKRIDITSVNGGSDYIFDQEAVNLFGWIWDTVEFDDITQASSLKSRGMAYLRECINFQLELELTAFDLHLLDVNIKSIRLGDWIRVVSKPHDLDRLFLVSKIDMDIINPEQSKIYLGGVTEAFTSNTVRTKKEISDAVQKVATSSFKEINDKVENATNLMTGANGGYLYIKRNNEGNPEELFMLDRPVLEEARNIIRLNKNGLGFSTTGVAGPYRNAWTIDGNLIADFITSGEMLCDRIRGGSLTLGGGNGANGMLRVLNSSGAEIGRWDREGINILSGRILANLIKGGTLTLGGNNNVNGMLSILDASGAEVGCWDRDGINIDKGKVSANLITSGTMSCDRLKGGSLALGVVDGSEGSLSVTIPITKEEPWTIFAANKNGVGIGGDYIRYDPHDAAVPLSVGGFCVIERNNVAGYGSYNYWETIRLDQNFTNGLSTGGPWAFWAGWDVRTEGKDPADYKFVVFEDGRCKAMSWITGSKAEDKENIKKFVKPALEIVKDCEVHEYDLKKGGAHRIGFVIGEDYQVSPEILDGDKSGIEMYSALAVAYKAIQELEEKILLLEEKVKEGIKNG